MGVGLKFAVSGAGRRIVGRFSRGVEIVDAILALCREQKLFAGELRGMGHLMSAEIAQFDEKGRSFRPPRSLNTPVELIHLYGNISTLGGEIVLRAQASLLRDDTEVGGGLTVLGGQLVRGVAHSVEFVIEAFDDLNMRRELDAEAGLPVLVVEAKAQPAERPAHKRRDLEESAARREPAAGGATAIDANGNLVSFGRAARSFVEPPRPFVSPLDDNTPLERPKRIPSTSEQTDDGIVETDREIQIGDWLEHPRFGRCLVQRIDDEEDRVTVRLENQRLIVLGLEVLTIEFLSEVNGQQVFRVQPRR
jgi:predicted DNA-binding protein with PD1-like motif